MNQKMQDHLNEIKNGSNFLKPKLGLLNMDGDSLKAGVDGNVYVQPKWQSAGLGMTPLGHKLITPLKLHRKKEHHGSKAQPSII
jgi:hypothetical protein